MRRSTLVREVSEMVPADWLLAAPLRDQARSLLMVSIGITAAQRSTLGQRVNRRAYDRLGAARTGSGPFTISGVDDTLRNYLWRAADEDRQRGRRVRLPTLLDAASRLQHIDWRTFAEVARLVPAEDAFAARANHLLEFVNVLANATKPRSVLDPWVTAPSLLAAAVDGSGAKAGCGLAYAEIYGVARYLEAIEWQMGNPLQLLQNLGKVRFDLVLVAPPFGLRSDREQALPQDPSGNVELADLVLWRAARHVSDNGSMLFHTLDSALWVNARRKIWPQLAAQGLHVRAVISVEGGAQPLTSVATSVVLFTRHSSDQVFIGRLESGTSIPSLVENLVARRASVDPQLGAILPISEFRGWKSFVLENQLANAFPSHDLCPLEAIGIVRRLRLTQGDKYDAPTNCIFVPTMGFGRVLTSPPDLEGKKAYTLIEVQLDPLVARAEYVAGLLSSPIGKQLRESLATGMTVPHLSVKAVTSIRVPVPPLSVQDEAARVSAHLASMIATVERLRGDLWRRPESALRVVSQLQVAAKADPVRRWIETLPYPLASILQRYIAQRDPAERVSALLHFFEATAQFGCVVLMSALRQSTLFEAVRSDIARSTRPGRPFLGRADFGLWINLGRTLTKSINRLNQDHALREELATVGGPASELVTRLVDKAVWSLLDQARPIRNERAHGGVTTSEQLRRWLVALDALISEVELLLGSAFDELDLVRAETARFRSGIFEYPRAQRLRGSSEAFEEFELQTRRPLESEHLVLVSRNGGVSNVLPLIPLVRLGDRIGVGRTACYFYSSIVRPGLFAYVSYQLVDEPRIEVYSDDLSRFLLAVTEEQASLPLRGQV